MIGNSFSKKIFILVSVFYILYVTLPLVGQVLPLSIQNVSIAVVALVVLTSPKAFKNKPTAWLLIYLGVLYTYVLLGRTLTISSISDEKSNMFKLFMEMAFILPSFSIMSVCVYFNDVRITKTLFYSAIMGLGASFLYLIPMTIINSNILRMAMHAEAYGITTVLGAPRYSLMHAYVIAAPPALLACLLHKKKMKTFFLIFFLMLAYMILRCYITTTIILLLGVIVAYFIRGSRIKKAYMVRLLVAIVLLLLLVASGGLTWFHNSISGFFEGSYAESKFEQLGMALSGTVSEENSLSDRISLHAISISSFFENPLLGYPQTGGHSNFLDRLGGMGLVCFIPYLMLLITIWQLFLCKLRNSSQIRFYYNVGCVIVFILLYEKGLFSFEGWTFYTVILPISSLYLSQKNFNMTFKNSQ